MNQEKIKEAALLLCSLTKDNPDELVPHPRQPDTLVPRLDIIIHMIQTQLLVAHCLEQVTKDLPKEAQ